MDELEISGVVPELNGKALKKLIVQEFWYDGICEEEANVVYLNVDNTWYRLYFDCGIVFWRQDITDFENEHIIKFDETVYKFRDLGNEFNIAGSQIVYCETEAIENGTKVTFNLNGRSSIAFKCIGDDTSWEA